MTNAAPDHSRVLRDAARAVLGPLGLAQKGRSRTWLDDRIWHVIVVEFQPSSWSRGTYVNVGVTWLWNVKDSLSFGYGPYRVQEFERADTGDWPERCQAAATLAATQVEQLRAEIPNIAAAATALSAIDRPGWPTFDAAIALGLVGEVDRASELFDRILAEDADTGWHQAMQVRAADLQGALGDPVAFRARVVGEIERTRAALRLPTLEAHEIVASLDVGGHIPAR